MAKKERLLLIIIILIGVFTTSGCGVKYCKTYLGNELPKDQVAWVLAAPRENVSVIIYSVDGKPLKSYGCGTGHPGLILLPGKHTLSIGLIFGWGFAANLRAKAKDLSLEARPAHFYAIQHTIKWQKPERLPWGDIFGSWEAWIVDCGEQSEQLPPGRR